MSSFSVTLPSGEIWTPKFVQSINENTCIGCGRCFKVCPRGVLEMVGVNEDTCIGCGRCFKVCPRGVLELVGLDHEGNRVAVDDDEDEDDAEYEKKVMTIAHGEMCIGCTACAKICPKKCYTHAAAAA